MREIKRLESTHIDAYANIAFNAYPSFKDFSHEARINYKKTVQLIMDTDPIVSFYGLFEDDTLIGVMRLFDFQMNLFGKIMPVSGLGFLGVHLLHKRKGVARQLIDFYEAHYLEKQVPIASLLPFRPDFYKARGYGFGTKMCQYRIPTTCLPNYSQGQKLRYLGPDDIEQILMCHSRVVDKSHGRMMKFGDEIRDLFGDPFNRVVGFIGEAGQLEGYLVYQFQNGKSGNYTINHIYIKEMIYERIAVLRQLLAYLKNQEEQVSLVIFNTQDEHFHYLFDNPLNDTKNYIPYGYLETNTQAIGMMYKVLDVAMAFKQCAHRQYNHVALAVKFNVVDDATQNVESTKVTFDGKAILGKDTYDLEVKLKRSDFSALFMGSTSVYGLYHLGLLELDKPELLEKLDLVFYCPQKPVCYTDF